jgi:hypothetical protein
MVERDGDVRFVPKADILRCGKERRLFDHLVGGGEQCLRECQTQRLCRLEVKDKIQLCGLFDWQIRWFRALQYLVHVCRAPPKEIGQAWAIRYQTACEYVFANYKHPGNSVAFKKIDDLADLQIEEWVGSRHQRVGSLAQYASQVRVEIR